MKEGIPLTTDLTEGKPSKKLFWFSLPLLLSVAFQQLYQMADSMIVGRFAITPEAGELALAAVGAIVLGLSLTVLLVLGPVTQWDIGAAFAIPVAIGGGVVLLCALGARLSAGAAAQGKPYSALPMAAISIDFGFAVLLFGGMFLYAVSSLLSLLGLLMAFLSIFTPFAGIACGIVALTKKSKLTKGGAALSIIAIALPVVVCAVVILLFSTGVWVIRLM